MPDLAGLSAEEHRAGLAFVYQRSMEAIERMGEAPFLVLDAKHSPPPTRRWVPRHLTN